MKTFNVQAQAVEVSPYSRDYMYLRFDADPKDLLSDIDPSFILDEIGIDEAKAHWNLTERE